MHSGEVLTQLSFVVTRLFPSRSHRYQDGSTWECSENITNFLLLTRLDIFHGVRPLLLYKQWTRFFTPMISSLRLVPFLWWVITYKINSMIKHHNHFLDQFTSLARKSMKRLKFHSDYWRKFIQPFTIDIPKLTSMKELKFTSMLNCIHQYTRQVYHYSHEVIWYFWNLTVHTT